MDLSEFKKVRSIKCKVQRASTRLNDEDQAKVKAALADPTIATTSIESWWIAKDDDAPHRCTIDRHRKGLCPCD